MATLPQSQAKMKLADELWSINISSWFAGPFFKTETLPVNKIEEFASRVLDFSLSSKTSSGQDTKDGNTGMWKKWLRNRGFRKDT